MQDNWEATTATATADSRALGIVPAGKRAQLVQLAGLDVGALYNLSGTLVIGRASDADVRIEGPGISRHHARVRIGGGAVEFEDLNSTNGSFINGQRVERRELLPGDKIQLGSGTILRFGYQDEIDADYYRLMFESGSRDMVTELCNKRFFIERLSTEFAFAVRHETPLLLVVFSLENMRAMERAFGTGMSNRVLCELARTTLATLRSEDVVAHFGGGTFAILSRGIDADAAPAICERLRVRAARLQLQAEDQPIAIALAFGSAALPHADARTPEGLLAMAQRSVAARS
jgi:diguanylate cyclase (GGDEF)-like protein